MSDKNTVVVEELLNFVSVNNQNMTVIVDELRNVVSVSATTPNLVTVTTSSITGATAILSGQAAPTGNQGAIGDYYIDTDDGQFYGPKTADGWGQSFFTAVTTATQQNERHTHVQSSPSATWTITHALGGRPSVTIVDSADTHVFGEVQYNSNTQVTATFSAAFSGKAYLT